MSRSLLPPFAVFCSTCLWGLWWMPLRRLGEAGLQGAVLNATLYLTAVLVVGPWLWRRRRLLREGGGLLLASGTLFGAAMLTWNLAVLNGEVVRVTLLFYLAPVWATLLARLVLGEAVVRLRALSILCGLGGAVAVLGLGSQVPLPSSLGDWLGLASGLLFAGSVTLVRLGRHIDGRDQALVAFVMSAVLSLAILPLLPGPVLPQVPGVVLLLAALVSVFWLLPITWLVLWGAGRMEPGRVSVLLLFEVLVAAVSAGLLAGEPFGPREAAGCLLILAAGLLEALQELHQGRRAVATLPPLPPRFDSDEAP